MTFSERTGRSDPLESRTRSRCTLRSARCSMTKSQVDRHGRGWVVACLVYEARIASGGARVGVAEQILDGAQHRRFTCRRGWRRRGAGVLGRTRPPQVGPIPNVCYVGTWPYTCRSTQLSRDRTTRSRRASRVFVHSIYVSVAIADAGMSRIDGSFVPIPPEHGFAPRFRICCGLVS